MASLSPLFMLDDSHKKKKLKNESALLLSLLSVVSGSIDPLIMPDTKDAQKTPVVFHEPADS